MTSEDAAATAGLQADPAEVGKFDRLAAQWWDETGQAAPLHAMNPCRLDYFADQIAAQFGLDRRAVRPLDGLTVLDVGCGGGLLAEPFSRLGAKMTGIDASEAGIAVAREHAARSGLPIDYRVATAEMLVAEGILADVVVASEVVEHVPDAAIFVATLGRLVRPGGLVLMSTLNRTPASFVKAILGAEFVMRWLPPGTHDWRRFLTPERLSALMVQAGLQVVDRTGLVYGPLSGRWRRDPADLSVNYAIAAVRET